ncbi:MAG: glycosyltransferase family 2 protein [Candidatus Omnitrophota bacterium]
MTAPKLLIIVLNYNQEEVLAQCLLRLGKVAYRPFEVLVVDNGSRKNPERLLKSRYPGVHRMVLPDNVGFAGGCNHGIRWALSQGFDAVVLLNNDAVTRPDFLEKMVQSAYGDPKIGVVGGVVYRSADLSRPYLAGMRFDFFRAKVKRLLPSGASAYSIPVVSGSCFLVKAEVLEEIGHLDERFFIYFEETDFCYRALKQGIRVVVDPQVKVQHEHGSTFGPESPALQYLYTRNRLLFISKQCPSWMRPWSFTVRILKDLVRILFSLLRGRIPVARAVGYALVDYRKGRFGKGRLDCFFHGQSGS